MKNSVSDWLVCLVGVVGLSAFAAPTPEEVFARPPHEADVGVWWHWMGSAVTEEGIVKDLDYFKSVGIGYATVFAVSDTVMPWATPVGLGPFRKVVAFTPEWFRLLRFACAEGRKRGIEIGLHNSPGYTSTGGPWIPARLAMRELVFNVSETNPVPLRVKANFPRWVPERGTQDVPELAERRTDLVDIGTVGGVRISHVPMGAFNQPAQPEATGLECDKLSAEAVTFHCDHVLGELKRHLGEELGTGLTYIHLDSYEAGKATWTPRMREEFKARKGYDCLPLLPALGGFRTAFPDKEEQFRKDYDEVLKDLYRDNLFKIMGAKVRAAGLRFSCEPYSGPFRPEDGLPEVDAPMDEFWFELPAKWHPPVTWNRATGPNGRRHNVIEAEAFTGQPQQTAWTETLAQIKAVGDIGLQRGLNRYFLHTCPLQPFADDVRPGMTMGRWGTHFGRTQTWARPAGAAWFVHQRRCQALLQWGEPSDAKLPLADPVRSTARTDGTRTLHFVVNGSDRNAAFGLEGTWFDPVTGTIGAAPRQLAPRQSGFFEQVRTDRPAAFGPVTGEPVATLAGPWRLEFGGGGCLARTELFDWTKSKNRDVRYFSGTGVYKKTFDLDAAALAANRLDLGETLGHVSEVTLNGRDLGTIWTAPWSVAVPAGLLKEKGNVIEIRYTNVWANRLIGDERESDDCAWKSGGQYGGWYPVEWPSWSLRSIRERPARGRKAYCAWKHYTADAPLVPSGLLGPVAFYREVPDCAAPDAAQGDVPLWPEGRMPSVQTNQTYAPYLRWFTPEKRTTDAILIAVSGGGYNGCSVNGFEVVPMRDYFLKKGMTVVTMCYRAPRPQGLAKHVTAWQDAQRTVRIVRSEAKRRGLDPDNIGFTGCSAGGHLAMMVAVSSQTPAYPPVDEIDRLPCNVNWAIPVYPAYLIADGANQHNVKRGNDLSDALVPELVFDAATPPMCFFHGDVDGWSAMGSVRAYHKLRTMGVPAELHVMALENHCFQSNPRPGTPAASWKDRVWEWLVSMDIVTGHPQVWRKDWTTIFPAWGPKLEKRADFVPGAWVLKDWGDVVLSAKQKGSSLWLKETFGDCELDLEFRPEAASALLFRPAADASTAVRLDLRDVESVKGGWNRLTVRCANGVLEVVANGRRQTAVQISVPSARPIRIGFEGHGDSYRNVRIRGRPAASAGCG